MKEISTTSPKRMDNGAPSSKKHPASDRMLFHTAKTHRMNEIILFCHFLELYY